MKRKKRVRNKIEIEYLGSIIDSIVKLAFIQSNFRRFQQIPPIRRTASYMLHSKSQFINSNFSDQRSSFHKFRFRIFRFDLHLTNRDHAHDVASPERIRALQIVISRRQFQSHLVADPSQNRHLSQVLEFVPQSPPESLPYERS